MPWAVAFHSTAALKEGIAPEDVEAIRARRTPKDPKVAALSGLTRALGTPQDITVQEIRIECFFPADDATERAARKLRAISR